MPQFNIHWKGYPHRRLPRIRVASPYYGTARNRRHAHRTTEEALQLPFGLALEKARLQQHKGIRRGDRSSRKTLESISTRSRAHPSAGSAVRKFGLKVPQGDAGTKVQTKESFGVGREHNQDQLTESVRKEGTYSRGRSRTHPKLPIRKARRSTKSTPSQLGSIGQSRCSSLVLNLSTKDKKPSSPSLSVVQAMSGSGSRLMSTDSFSPPKPLSTLFSRTRSQQVALKNFSRGLERHLIAQEAVRKACLSVSSSSASTLSANTIVEFVPYLAEFQAAGLAVTSAQQRRPVNRQSKVISVPVRDRDTGDNVQTSPKENEQMENGQAIVSLDGSDVSLYTNATSSRTTMIAFSTPSAPNSIMIYPNRNAATKRPLPWLRKAQNSTPADYVNVIDDMKSSSGSTCETCATTIIDFSPGSKESERKQNERDPSPIRRQTDVKYIDMDDSSVGLARSQSDDTYSGNSTGSKSVQSAQTPKLKQRARTILAKPDSRRTGKDRLDGDPVPQRSRKTLPPQVNATSSISIGPFCAPPKFLAQEPTSSAKDPKFTNLLEDAAAITHKTTQPPACSPPSAPARNSPLAYKLACESSGTPIRGPYDFETPSIFEQALNDIVAGSYPSQNPLSNEENVNTDPSLMNSVYQGNCDPVKRRSTSYKPSEPSPSEFNVGSTSPLGLATTSDTPTMISTDHSTIRDKDVLKGLQITLAAACDESVDSWITKTSGYQVRKFLADLSAFEGLGVDNLVDKAMRTAKKRRKEYNRTRENEHVHVHDLETMPLKEVPKKKERKEGGMATYSGRRGLLIAEMLRRRDMRAGESVNERALRMGWRHRSVSAGY